MRIFMKCILIAERNWIIHQSDRWLTQHIPPSDPLSPTALFLDIENQRFVINTSPRCITKCARTPDANDRRVHKLSRASDSSKKKRRPRFVDGRSFVCHGVRVWKIFSTLVRPVGSHIRQKGDGPYFFSSSFTPALQICTTHRRPGEKREIPDARS